MGPLIAYDSDGNVVGTLDHLIHLDGDGNPHLIDFEAHEAAGGEHTDYFRVEGVEVKGAKVWPEWLGKHAHAFRVELEGPAGQKRIAALIHKESGHRRDRASIEAVIAATPIVDGARDIRHIVGGPTKHLQLDERGQTKHHEHKPLSHVPMIGRTR